METTTSPATRTQDNLLRKGAIALVGSVIANLIVWAILEAVLDIPADFMPLSPGPIAIFTALGAIGATIAYWLVRRISSAPDRTFRFIALIALLLSIIPNLLFGLNPEVAPFPFPVVATGMFALILFHVVAAVVDIWALTA